MKILHWLARLACSFVAGFGIWALFNRDLMGLIAGLFAFLCFLTIEL